MESSDPFTAKQGFFDRTLALHTERLRVSWRGQDTGPGADEIITKGNVTHCKAGLMVVISSVPKLPRPQTPPSPNSPTPNSPHARRAADGVPAVVVDGTG